MKLLVEFSANASRRDGRQPYCKVCTAISKKGQRRENKESKRIHNKLYRERHKEAIRIQRKAYRLANQQTIQAWRKANKERIKDYPHRKAYREANKDKIAVYQKEYRATPNGSAALKAYRKTPGYRATIKAAQHKRRTRAEFAFDELATSGDFRHWEEHGAVCYLTGIFLSPGNVSLDHVVPLCWGGTHDVWNIQPASLSANLFKHNRIVYFDLTTRQARFTTDPCPGGVGPSGETWPRIPLRRATLYEMETMVNAYIDRHSSLITTQEINPAASSTLIFPFP